MTNVRSDLSSFAMSSLAVDATLIGGLASELGSLPSFLELYAVDGEWSKLSIAFCDISAVLVPVPVISDCGGVSLGGYRSFIPLLGLHAWFTSSSAVSLNMYISRKLRLI